MKKLLVLLIVLAMTTVASANSMVVITVNDQPWEGQDVMPSDMIQIVLMDLVNDNLQNVNVGTTINVSLGDSWTHTWAGAPMFPSSIFTPVEAGYSWAGNAGYMFVPMPEDDTVFVNEFHVPDDAMASDWINIEWTISYMTDEPMPYNGSAMIHVIPEPATLALLGLGGLFLRRRKKA